MSDVNLLYEATVCITFLMSLVGYISILLYTKKMITLVNFIFYIILIKRLSLLYLRWQEQEPSFSCSLDEAGTVKDFRWQKNMEKSFVVLSSRNTLYHGNSKAELKNVIDKVDAGLFQSCIKLSSIHNVNFKCSI